MERFLIQHLDMNKGKSGENWHAHDATLEDAQARCDAVYGPESSGVRQEITDSETSEAWFRADGQSAWRQRAKPK